MSAAQGSDLRTGANSNHTVSYTGRKRVRASKKKCGSGVPVVLCCHKVCVLILPFAVLGLSKLFIASPNLSRGMGVLPHICEGQGVSVVTTVWSHTVDFSARTEHRTPTHPVTHPVITTRRKRRGGRKWAAWTTGHDGGRDGKRVYFTIVTMEQKQTQNTEYAGRHRGVEWSGVEWSAERWGKKV